MIQYQDNSWEQPSDLPLPKIPEVQNTPPSKASEPLAPVNPLNQQPGSESDICVSAEDYEWMVLL